MLRKDLLIDNFEITINSKVIWINRFLVFSLAGLILVLPIAHTVTIRAFFFLSALFLWITKGYLTRKTHLKHTPLDIFILFYLITIVISFFTTLNLSSSLKTLKGEFLTNTLLFYLIVANISEEKVVKKLIAILLIGSAIMAIYGIVDFFLKGGALVGTDYTTPYDRLGSLHQGYEAYGQYLIMVLPFNFLGIIYSTEKPKKILLSVLLILNIFALYLTHTRGAWLAFWFEMIIISYFIFTKRQKTVLIGLLILVPIIALYILPENMIWHGKKGLSTKEEDIWQNTGTIRLVMWKESIKSLIENPFVGAGYGKANFKRKFADKPFAGLEQAHNTFINTAIQLGIQGLIALLLIILMILNMTWKGWMTTKKTFRGLYYLGVFSMTIGFFIACQFAEFFIDDTARMFWILVGLSVSLYIRKDKDKPIKHLSFSL